MKSRGVTNLARFTWLYGVSHRAESPGGRYYSPSWEWQGSLSTVNAQEVDCTTIKAHIPCLLSHGQTLAWPLLSHCPILAEYTLNSRALKESCSFSWLPCRSGTVAPKLPCLSSFNSHVLVHAFFSLTHLCCSTGVHPANVAWNCYSSSSVWCRSFSFWRVSPRQCSLRNGQVSWTIPGTWEWYLHRIFSDLANGAAWSTYRSGGLGTRRAWCSGTSRSMQLLSKGIQTILAHHPIKIFFFLSCMELQNP